MDLGTVVFQQDPFSNLNSYGYKEVEGCHWNTNSSSPEVCTGDGLLAGASVEAPARRKRQRNYESLKNKVEMENQRMTHIAVERNRRKQMNDYLAVLRSLMPPSYTQRGDQASIVGGAINFVKQLEQLLQSLESKNQLKQQSESPRHFANFFTFPQYSTRSTHQSNLSLTGHESRMAAEKESTIADIEVSIVESHANIKVLSRRQQKQLLKMVSWFYSTGLTILHINVTSTVDQLVLYSFSVKVEDYCQLSTVNEIATAVHEMMTEIQEEVMPSYT
ncbi:hypothetical protein RHGRI_022405 [Rhododendron griersonianum]|uniref:BHLH domain-containing protein n=1 Tax=Rhododendron griersonianum TaxID=479676 RepID=A0AAV6IZE2_9ERIC|nr:hypothetical protein RHGRI_022405 [Rhododendron griersonianum]